MDTLRSVSHLQRELGDEFFGALINSDNTEKVRRFAKTLLVDAKKAVDKFIVAGHFTTDNASVKISFLGENFREWFLGKVEEPAETTLPKFHHDLGRNSLDEEALADIGGADKAEVTLSGIYELMKRQPKGEAGGLLTNGHGNIFFVKDVEGVLRAVYVRWGGDGWGVGVARVDDVGSRVFSRNS